MEMEGASWSHGVMKLFVEFDMDLIHPVWRFVQHACFSVLPSSPSSLCSLCDASRELTFEAFTFRSCDFNE